MYFFGSHEAADAGHGFGEGGKVHVHVLLHAVVFVRTGTGGSHGAEAVRVVYHQAELEVFLQRHDVLQVAQVARHAEHAFGDDEDAAALFFGQCGGMFKLFAQAFHVVVLVHEAFAHVQAQAVHDAGVGFGVVHNHVLAAHQRVDDGEHGLVAEVDQVGCRTLDESCQAVFQLDVPLGLAGHHAGAHGSRHAELCRGFGIRLAHFRVVGQAEVVVQTPVQHFLAVELHVRAYFAFEDGEHEIAVRFASVLTEIAFRFLQSVKNIYHRIIYVV